MSTTALFVVFAIAAIVSTQFSVRLFRRIEAQFPTAAKKLNVSAIGPRPWRTLAWIYWGFFRPSELELPAQILTAVRIDALISIAMWIIFAYAVLGERSST